MAADSTDLPKPLPNPVKIGFDPTAHGRDEESRLVHLVFADPLARTLWLGIKQGHIVNQYFTGRCLDAAGYLQATKMPATPTELKGVLQAFLQMGFADEFIRDLFPYVRGERTLEYRTC